MSYYCWQIAGTAADCNYIMKNQVYLVNKQAGETPLRALERLRKVKRLGSVSLTYAGRLDPMASGLVLVLAGKAIEKKEQYLSLPKTYEAVALLGFTSDSGDILGLAKKQNSKKFSSENIRLAIYSLKGRVDMALPRYASVPVNGKPLWVWARAGQIVKTPKRQSLIYSIRGVKIFSLPESRLLSGIVSKISKVKGDFRQKNILEKWKKLLSGKTEKYVLVKFTVRCSSGTYIRSLAEFLGKRVGSGGILYALKRTGIGKYKL